MGDADALLRIDVTDDVGARTADLFHWQAAMAAADGIAALLDELTDDLDVPFESTSAVVCEHHEDWVMRISDQLEIVSAKHREPHVGPWSSITVLVSDGGLGHLFTRWLRLERKVVARLVSCASMSTGEASQLARCPDLLRRVTDGQVLSDSEQKMVDGCIDKLGRAIMMHRKELPAPWRAAKEARAKKLVPPDDLLQAVREFLAVMYFDTARPGREFAAHAAPSLYAEPLTIRMKQPAAIASVVWISVLRLFEVRMRARGATGKGGLPKVAAATDRAGLVTGTDELESRTVTTRDILVAVRSAIQNPGAYMPLARPAKLTKLSVKMAHGGCSDTSIARAERLRLDFARYRRVREATVPGSSAERGTIERHLLRIADEETARTRTAVGRWGPDFWGAMSARMTNTPPQYLSAGLDGELALGGLADLASRCQVWFSPGFDVDLAIAAEKKARGEKS
ncbi:hypothetical protein NQ152_15895 [Microbacterium sp. zg.B48]|uniref:hypothetical protein n=1 Tax=Microbacterium sp. zg.B48 TaxID=2969408 RepID=UPI00214BD35F|nr:hypothetical protein [Microbacterium sp. zg.B48]MCR2764988.1 hypothetical protein [Microbacterium sp. zg.B48]